MDAGFLLSPVAFAGLVMLATMLVWAALAPARPTQQVQDRLNDLVVRGDPLEDTEMRRPFLSRTVAPLFRRLLLFLGRLGPKRNSEMTQRMLWQAGSPMGLTALDFTGLRLLCVVLFGAAAFFLLGRTLPFSTALRNALLIGALGFFAPQFWLRSRARRRQHDIQRALPDALDMLTIGVQAGLAFESALIRVCEQWDNALTREFRRAVAEMRVGTARDVALRRMVDRAGVAELQTFVTILIQSGQMGVSIAEVLHTQSSEMRVMRRQRAEELARQAGIKMVFPLVFLLFPALFIVILGPSVPTFLFWLQRLGGGN